MSRSGKTIANRSPAPRATHTGKPNASPKSKQFVMPPSVSRPELLEESGTSDRRFRQLLYDISALGSLLESARSYLAGRLGLSSPQYNLVMIVAQYQGAAGVSGSEVARHLHVSTAFVTSESGKLEQAGWLRKLPNPRDGRGVLLRLTPFAVAEVRKIGPERRRVNDHLFRHLSGKDFRHLAASAARLIDDFSVTLHMLKAGPMPATRSRPTGRPSR